MSAQTARGASPVTGAGKAPLLEVRDIQKRYGGVQALKGVSFDVRPGEIHALLGENGAGKSTLIKILAGAERADRGSLALDGEIIHNMTPREGQRRGIAVVYQEFSLVPDLSVLENLFLGREPARRRLLLDRRRAEHRANEVAERMGTPLLLHAPVHSLSVAERQRVEIARALSFDARLIIMDEPSAVLAGKELEQLFQIVRSLRDQGVSVIYISHRLVEIRELADRVTVLKDGARVATRDVDGMTEPDLIRLMVGRNLEPALARATATDTRSLEMINVQLHRTTEPFNLVVRAGEVVGLAGLVGSGRSSVANLLAGLAQPFAGEVRRGGQRVKISTPRHSISARIAVIPEDRRQEGLLLPMSVSDNVGLPNLRRLQRFGLLQRRRERQLAQQSIRDLDIRPPLTSTPVGLLSGGNQQKVVLGKWLARQPSPEVFVLDEPTRGVDVGAKFEVHRLIADLAEQGAAVLLISSELPEILSCSHRVVVMRDGTVAGELGKDEVNEEGIMRLAVGTVTRHESAGSAAP
jgi:rhamnose transport system ATP-binding protein